MDKEPSTAESEYEIFMDDRIVEIMRESLRIFSQLRDILWKLIEDSREVEPKYSNFSHAQFYYFSQRCQSVNILIQEDKLWDCEILMRAALECATRFIFVSIADKEERDLRILEYSVHLNEVEDIQRSEKAKTAANANKTNADIQMLIGGAVLPEEDEALLRARWPKTKRLLLKQKWSFSEMVKEIKQFHKKLLDLRNYDLYLHSYGIGSHLIHADQTAINLVWDRNHRGQDEKKKMIQSHMTRLIVDQIIILFLCWRSMAYALNVESVNIQLVKDIFTLMESTDAYHQAFADSQRDFYKNLS